MFEVSVSAVFSAAHAITIGGAREQIHGHDWHVTAAVEGETLDADGLLLDFHAAERALAEIVRPFNNANLNDAPEFRTTSPTAEAVAAHIAGRLGPAIAPPARLAWVRVTEAPGCAVTYRVPAGSGHPAREIAH